MIDPKSQVWLEVEKAVRSLLAEEEKKLKGDLDIKETTLIRGKIRAFEVVIQLPKQQDFTPEGVEFG